MGWNLNRKEAIALSREAIILLQERRVTAIKLTESIYNSKIAFQVRIQALFDKQTTMEIKRLSEKKGLSVEFQNDEAVIS